jgi:hypothetical protein
MISLSDTASKIKDLLHSAITNKWSVYIIYILLILYSAFAVPTLSDSALNVINHPAYKFFILFFILILAKVSPIIAILLTVAFILSVNRANKVIESLEDVIPFEEAVPSLSPVEYDEPAAPQSAPQTVESTIVAEPVIVQPQIVTNENGESVVVNPSIKIVPAQVIDSNGDLQQINPVVDMSSSIPFKPITEQADSAVPLQSGCLPHRNVDMSAVVGIEEGGIHSTVSF